MCLIPVHINLPNAEVTKMIKFLLGLALFSVILKAGMVVMVFLAFFYTIKIMGEY